VGRGCQVLRGVVEYGRSRGDEDKGFRREEQTSRIVRYTIIIPHAPISGKCGYPILVLVTQH
jgi:hypothetical protein